MFVIGERGKSEYSRKKLYQKSMIVISETRNSTVYTTKLNPDHIGNGK